MNDNRFKRKVRRPLGAARGLEEKVNEDMGGPTGLALEMNFQPSQNSIAGTRPFNDSGIYGQRRNRSLSARHMRVFPPSSQSSRFTHATPAQSVAQSSHSRFSQASGTTGGAGTATAASAAGVHVICAISENLARETCVSSLDAGSPTSMHVSKQGNNQVYAETIAYLEMLQPDEVLLNEGRCNSQMVRKILEFYATTADQVERPMGDNRRRNRAEDTDGRDDEDRNSEGTPLIKFVSRSSFDQTRGAELLKRIAREESYDASVLDEYILLASSHALLHHVQHALGAAFLRNSLYLNVNAAGSNKMTIDRSTMLQLELLVNAKTGKVKESLIGSIDCTKTTVGSRLLRANLMAPPTGIETIHSRLELVGLFLSSKEILFTVSQQLDNLPDIDRMLSSIALVPRNLAKAVVDRRTKQRMASKGISALVCIKSTLATLPSFADTIRGLLGIFDETIPQDNSAYNDDATIATGRTTLMVALGNESQRGVQLGRHRLLQAILVMLTQPRLSTVLEAVSDIFTNEAKFHRRSEMTRYAECFAFKCEVNSMMTVLRKSFEANVDEIYQMADEYAEQFGIKVGVRYSTSRGYFFAIPVSVDTSLPPCFVLPIKSGRFITCTTNELVKTNNRVQENVHELLLMTHQRIQEVMEVVRTHYDVIASICDAVALLDMCHCFAENVVTTSSMKWCRPSFSEPLPSGDDEENVASHVDATSIVIIKGRYPISVAGFEGYDGPSELVPNDTYATDGKHFTVITGINGSGKSTYLKQVAILVIMAHCGSYVTAEKAIIPLRDRVCCRIGNTDDQKHNLSTFMLEMRETAFICNSATSRSLILMDELGRATSNEDGVAIAWATSEYLLKKRALTFFVTHYPQLTTLANIYPCVQNIHLEASVSGGNSGDIRYAHKARPGACSVSTDYGIEMAVACGWPLETVDKARSVQEQVQALLPDEGLCSPDHVSDNRTKAFELLAAIGEELRGLIRNAPVQSHATFRAQLHALQERHVAQSPNADIVTAMKQLLLNGSTNRRTLNRTAATQSPVAVRDDPEAASPAVRRQGMATSHGDESTLDSAPVQARRVTTSPICDVDDATGHGHSSTSSSSEDDSDSDDTTLSSDSSKSGRM